MNYKNYEKCKKNGIQRIFKILSITYIIEKRKKRKEKYLYIERYLCGVGEALSLSRLSLHLLPSNPSIICPKPSNNISTNIKRNVLSIPNSRKNNYQLSRSCQLSCFMFVYCLMLSSIQWDCSSSLQMASAASMSGSFSLSLTFISPCFAAEKMCEILENSKFVGNLLN